MYYSDLPDESKKSQLLETIQKVLAIAGGTVSFYLAMSFICARVFYAAYFTAMGIDFSLLDLSWIKYVEIGWLFPFAILVGVVPVFLLTRWLAVLCRKLLRSNYKYLNFIGIIFFVSLCLSFLPYFSVIPRDEYIISKKSYDVIYILSLVQLGAFIVITFREKFEIIYKKIQIGYIIDRIALFIILAAFLLLCITLLLYLMHDLGTVMGREATTEDSEAVILVATQPLQLDGLQPTVEQVAGQTTLTYQGLRLLTNNNGRYFLFRNINAECKPQQVFIVLDTEVQINIVAAPPLAPDCIPATK